MNLCGAASAQGAINTAAKVRLRAVRLTPKPFHAAVSGIKIRSNCWNVSSTANATVAQPVFWRLTAQAISNRTMSDRGSLHDSSTEKVKNGKSKSSVANIAALGACAVLLINIADTTKANSTPSLTSPNTA
jgi:hypothetical protein